jgi:hypothetical protein
MTKISRVANVLPKSLDYIEAMTCFMHTNNGCNGYLNGLALERTQLEALKLSYPECKSEYSHGSNQIGTDIVFDGQKISTKSGLDSGGRVRISFTTGQNRSTEQARDYLAAGHQDGVFFSAHSEPYGVYDYSHHAYTWKIDYKVGYICGSLMDGAILRSSIDVIKTNGDVYFDDMQANLKIRFRKNGSGDMWLDYNKLGKILKKFTVQENPVSGIWYTNNQNIKFSTHSSIFNPQNHIVYE